MAFRERLQRRVEMGGPGDGPVTLQGGVTGAEVGGEGTGVLAHDVGAARDHDAAGLHDDHRRAQLEHERDVVLDEKDGRPGDLLEAAGAE